MNEITIHKLAEQYLSGELKEEEGNRFRERLETDEEFAQIFAQYLIAKQKTKELAEAEWKAELMASFDTKAEKIPQKEASKRPIRALRWISAVAAVFVLVFAAFWLWQSPDSQDLFADASEQIFEERISKLRKGRDFITLFKAQDFTAALAAAEQQYTQADETDKVLWLERKGFCLWQLEKWQDALLVFKELENNPLLRSQSNPAVWYQALTYLASGDKEQCKLLLRKIIALPKHDDQDKAGELLKQL